PQGARKARVGKGGAADETVDAVRSDDHVGAPTDLGDALSRFVCGDGCVPPDHAFGQGGDQGVEQCRPGHQVKPAPSCDLEQSGAVGRSRTPPARYSVRARISCPRPSRSRAAMAVGHIPRAPPMSEGPDRRSRTSTCRPPRTRPRATARPAMPPPTTTTFPSMPTKLKAGAPLNEPDHGVFQGHPFLKPLAVPAHCLHGRVPHLSDELREEIDSSKI